MTPHSRDDAAARTDRLIALLDDFQGTRVVIVGDLMLDEYIWGRVRRISPEAPVPVVEVEDVRREVRPQLVGGRPPNVLRQIGGNDRQRLMQHREHQEQHRSPYEIGLGSAFDCRVDEIAQDLWIRQLQRDAGQQHDAEHHDAPA